MGEFVPIPTFCDCPSSVLTSIIETITSFFTKNNLGVENAKGKYILLLNNDTILISPLKPVLEYIKQSNNIGAAGIRMLNANKEYLISAGKFPQPLNLYRLKNMFKMGKEFKSGMFSKKFYTCKAKQVMRAQGAYLKGLYGYF